MEAAQEITVCLGKDVVVPGLRSRKSRKIVRIEKISVSKAPNNLFFVCKASLVRQDGPLIVEYRKHLRGLLVLQDVEPRFVPPLLREAKLRNMGNLIVPSTEELYERVHRILNAWEARAATRLIADATVVRDLLIQSCDFKLYRFPFDSVRALKKLPATHRDSFEIASDGSYLHWPEHDIHLDLDALRYATDPQFRDEKDRQRALHNERFGVSVAAFRRERGLTQTNMPGISEREIRRIEKGETFPRTSTLEVIAEAHGLNLRDYIAEIGARVRKPSSSTRLN